MSYYEYEARMYAYRLKRVDVEHDMHLSAWLNHQAGAQKEKTKGKTEAVYKEFNDFFDYKKELKNVDKEIGIKDNISTRQRHLARVAAIANGA